MNEWLGRYLAHLEVERGYAANTLQSYRRILRDFLEFLGPQGSKLRRLRRDALGRYVLELRDARANSAHSIRLKLQAIRSFLGYLTERGAGPRDTSLGKNDFRYKTEHREVESLSQSQLTLLLDTVAAEAQQAWQDLERASGAKKREVKHYPDCRIIPRGQQWVGGLCFEQALDAG